MRDRLLKEKIRALCVESAQLLAAEIAAGDGIPYDLVDAGPGDGSHQPLWEYRVLTAELIAGRQGALAMLDAWLPAVAAVETLDQLDEWLLSRGEQHVPAAHRERVEATLRVFLREVIESDSGTIEFDEARFQRGWASFEAVTYAGGTSVLLAAPLHGVELESAEFDLGNGLMLVAPESAEAEGLPGDIFRREGLPVAAAVVEAGDASPDAIADARNRIRKLVCALRLWSDGSPALGGAARLQVENGPWQVLGLEGSGTARGTFAISTAEEGEISEFVNLIADRWPSRGEIAWALRRHEFGCDRIHWLDGLSDHLLALRALLEPEGPESGRLNARLAAICAEPAGQAALAERTARTAALERGVVTGLTRREPQAEQLCRELEMNLRAILRDVICGHLQADLVTFADERIAQLAGVEPPRRRRRFGEPEPIAPAAEQPDPFATTEFDTLDGEREDGRRAA